MKQQILYSLEVPETPQEENASQLLTEGNLSFVRNQLAVEAQRRINLDPPTDASGYVAFVQMEAEIKGAMRAYQFLLDGHIAVLERVQSEHRPAS